MSAWDTFKKIGGAALGVLGGPVGSILGAGLSAWGAKEASDDSAKFNKEAYQNRHQWEVADLKKAGLNPMLAVGGSPGQVAPPNFENVGEAAVRGAGGFNSARLTAAQTQAALETAEAQRATANKTMAEGKAQEMTNLITEASLQYQSAKATLGEHGQVTGASAVAVERWNADLKKTVAEAEQLGANTKNAGLEAALKEGQLTLQQVEVKYADQLKQIEASYRRAMAEAAAAGVPAAQADAAFWKNAGDLGKWASFFKSLIK